MSNSKILFLILIFLSFQLSSCKKAGKEIAEIVTKEAAEKGTKAAVTEASKKTLKTLTKKELQNIDWNTILRLIKKENLNLADALSKIDGGLQKKIGKAITSDYEFYNALISSHTLVDEFTIFTNKAPKAAKDINIFKYFAKARDMERRFGVPNSVSSFVLSEDMGIIKLINKTDKRVLGEYKDGVVLLKDAFQSNSDLLGKNSLLKKTLIPNSVYKIKGANGLTFLYHVDDLGRFSKIETKGVNADQLLSNVVFAKDNLKLGNDWNNLLKKVRQSSRGNDIDATLVLKYADDGTTPLVVKTDIKVQNKKIVSQSFENLENVSNKVYTVGENSKILDNVTSKVGLSSEKKADLMNEMAQDDGLAKLIHANPELNVRRWLNTRNHVDQTKLAKTASGRFVPNGRVYAGNTYYFNPHLNSGLNARLKNGGTINLKKFGSLSYDDLIKLDRLYPEGVPFTKEGFPDFTKVAFKDKNGNTLRVNIGQLSGDSKKDINAAETLFQKMGYKWEAGYTWHHIENSTELIRVPSAIHQLVDHAGGMTTHAAESVVKQAA